VGGGENRTSPGRPRAMASAFPIRPGNRRDDGRPPDVPMVHMSADGEGEGALVPLPSIDISKISFAAMGGSAEDLRHAFPENDVAYDVDSSDEDLDGMEAAVERYERRAAERASLKAAAEANEDAARRLASETRETARAVESLREQRRRFEEARAVAERGGASPDNPTVTSSIPGADERDDEDIDDEDRQLIELRERRRRVDERIARLLQEASSYDRTKESEKESVDELALAVNDRERRRVMEEEAESRRFDEGNEYVPRWKRRQEERWAREAAEAAALLERAELGRNTAGHATIAPPSPLYAVPATEPVAKDRRIEDERIKHAAAAPARGHHARPPPAEDTAATISRTPRVRSWRTEPRTSHARCRTSRPWWTPGTRREIRCFTSRRRSIGNDASRLWSGRARTRARGTTRGCPWWRRRSRTNGSSWRTIWSSGASGTASGPGNCR